MVGSFNKYITQ